ncbi:endonuclease/exonuclease/phosphatase family protein [bacterium]|nr:endonuclease/exonuclease/phosphatase family protein [bacterium]
MAQPRSRTASSRARLTVALIVTALLAAAWIQWRSSRPWPPRPAPGHLRVATYNIRAGLGGLDGIVADLEPIHADLIALQEVEHGMARPRSADQAGHIAKALGMEEVFAGSFPVEEGEYGIAVLSRFPITKSEKMSLPQGRGRWPRVALKVEVDTPDGPMRFVCVHLARPWHWPLSNTFTRLAQIRALLASIDGETLPVVVAGDMNSLPYSVEAARLARTLDPAWEPWRDGWGTSFSLETIGWPGGAIKIDHVLHDDRWRSHGTWVAPGGASDHRPVFCDLSRRDGR